MLLEEASKWTVRFTNEVKLEEVFRDGLQMWPSTPEACSLSGIEVVSRWYRGGVEVLSRCNRGLGLRNPLTRLTSLTTSPLSRSPTIPSVVIRIIIQFSRLAYQPEAFQSFFQLLDLHRVSQGCTSEHWQWCIVSEIAVFLLAVEERR